uniref:HECT domain-containing protein n=1 Tax=Knipowitschia caucasica TaxID=637954 RepID=A0AAV2LNF4_KNICA
MSDKNEDQLRNMVSSIINMIRSDVQGQSTGAGATAGQATGQQTRREAREAPSCSATQQNMARCFPGLFKGKKRVAKRVGVKRTPVPFLLLSKSAQKTPPLAEEMTLLQAGMGKKTVPIPEDATHKEISEILMEAFPSMEKLEGGWLIHKAMGGSGQRRLNVITPEEEGYMGSSLVKAWGGRESCSKIPQTSNQIIQVEDDEVTDIAVDTGIVSKIPDQTEDSSLTSVHCPLCWEDFTTAEIHFHASMCEGNEKTLNPETTSPSIDSLSDILRSLAGQVDQSKLFVLNVTRDRLFERGLKQWVRQKTASPANPLRINFIGEQGIDDGALRREFLTEMMRGLEAQLFEGSATGKNPIYSISAYQDSKFKICGEIMAVSVVQGGPAPNFLSPWSYRFLACGQMPEILECDEVTDGDISSLIQKVQDADDDTFVTLLDAIVACGYTGRLQRDCKEKIVNAIRLHSLTRLAPMLKQILEGLTIYGFNELLQKHSFTLQPLFLPGNIKQVDSEWLLQSLRPQFSDVGSVKRKKEIDIINFLQDLLQSLEDEEVEDEDNDQTAEVKKPLSVTSLFQWISGQAHVPLIDSERGI